MNIEIKNRFDGAIIIAGEYASIRDAVEKNRGADLSYANLSSADLSSADLRHADLSYANLSSADLSSANLSYANLSSADLSYADMRGANLSSADLSYADMRGADLDFSCLHFSCKTLHAKTDERQRIQLAFHFLSWIRSSGNATDEEKAIYNFMLEYANRFHRNDVERLEKYDL